MIKSFLLACMCIMVGAFPVIATESGSVRIQITAAGRVLPATLMDNTSTRALIAQFPLTVPMKDLYSREMTFRLAE